MIWRVSHRADPFARDVADRHYSRQTPGHVQFVKPGRCLVLKALTETGRAYWVTSWQDEEFTKHRWPGAWECAAFRNEGAGLSSDMILQAVAATRARFGEPPALGMITFVDGEKTSRGRSRASAPGECFLRAGFEHVGETIDDGLHVLQLLPARMPEALPALGTQLRLVV